MRACGEFVGKRFGKDDFDELLERVREIRAYVASDSTTRAGLVIERLEGEITCPRSSSAPSPRRARTLGLSLVDSTTGEVLEGVS